MDERQNYATDRLLQLQANREINESLEKAIEHNDKAILAIKFAAGFAVTALIFQVISIVNQ